MSVNSVSSLNTDVAADSTQSALGDPAGVCWRWTDTALQSGDLQAAQSALRAQQPTALSRARSSTTPSKINQFSTDLQTIGQALRSGNLRGAQQALAAMKPHRKHDNVTTEAKRTRGGRNPPRRRQPRWTPRRVGSVINAKI